MADRGDGSGRGAAARFSVRDVDLVYKDYHRGGLPARLVRDTYLGSSLDRTRMWREFRLLARLRTLGLPVPQPVAARCTRSSPITYRGDLITRELPDTSTLAEVLGHDLPPDLWRRVGTVIRRFHDHDVYHADLNAHNILLDATGDVHVLDFDRGSVRRHAAAWKRANLTRLRRSLQKLHASRPSFHFSTAGWRALLEGYRGGD